MLQYLFQNADDQSQIDLRIREFRGTADAICAVAAKHGLEIVGYQSSDLPLYRALTAEKQKHVLWLLKKYWRSLLAVEAFGWQPEDNNRSVWAALSTLGLIPPANLFPHFKSGMAIEIYDMSYLQIWRNFTCLRYCSYTLEEIYAIDAFARYRREPERAEECVTKVTALVIGQTPEVYYPDIAPHVLEETLSRRQLKLQVHHQMLCTLRDRSGKIAAWLGMSEAKVIGKGKRFSESKAGEVLAMPEAIQPNLSPHITPN